MATGGCYSGSSGDPHLSTATLEIPKVTKRCRINLGCSDWARKVYARWQEALNRCGCTSASLIEQLLDLLEEKSQLYKRNTKEAGVQCEETVAADMPTEDGLSRKRPRLCEAEVKHQLRRYVLERRAMQEESAATSLFQVAEPMSSPSSSPSLRASFFVDSDVSPISLKDTSCSSVQGVATSTPNRLHRRSISDPSLMQDITTELDGDGNVIVDLMDHSKAMEDEYVDDHEESLIQSFVCDEVEELPSSLYSSSVNPYTTVNYTSLDEELKLVKELKCFASISQLIKLVGTTCHKNGCGAVIQDISFHSNCGYVAKLSWSCEKEHRDSWYSSPIYGSGFAVNDIVNSAILYSGSSPQQFNKFCSFVGLVHPSPSSYYRFQRLYAAPTVHQEYEAMHADLVDRFSATEGIVISGDCRMDSPGYSAVKGTYTAMEHDTGTLLSMEHGDKRQVNLKSTNLEAHLFKKVLSGLLGHGVPIKEVVTDAHVQIISIMRKVPEFKDLLHSLDVWHKASKISKKVSEASKKKNCDDLAGWAPAIRNHFWFICRECNGDAEQLRILWTTILHHVCNTHDWAYGKCKHEPIDQPGEGRKWLDPESPAAEALRDIIFDRRWLNSLPFYVHNRHTGGLESFHNLVLSYAPKRIGYKHDAYIARMELAFLDHNHHLGRPQLTTRSGQPVYTRKWGKRTSKWHVVSVPVPKTYTYMPELIAKTLNRKHLDINHVSAVGMKSCQAKLLFPTIAPTPAPPTEQLLEEHVSRKTMRQSQI